MSISYDISANIIYQLHLLEDGELVFKIVRLVFQIWKLLSLPSSEALASLSQWLFTTLTYLICDHFIVNEQNICL